MRSKRKLGLVLLTVAAVVCLLTTSDGLGQTVATVQTPTAVEREGGTETTVSVGAHKDRPSDAERIGTLEATLRQQGAQLDELRKLVSEQQEMISRLAGKLGGLGGPAPAREDLVVSATASPEPGTPRITVDPQVPAAEDRLKKLETRVADIGSVKFSGDIRLRAESIFAQSNALANGGNPGILGNELGPRHRMRLRARLTIRGAINDEFDWGLRLATGSFADNISTNQTLTDFFNRKPFGLDQAFMTYKPRRAPGVRVQGGRFEPPWTFTEMTIDNDLMVDGFNESYSRTFKKSSVKELTFVAWQLPLLERNSAFVRNIDGTINLEESRRGGRDLALYGGQVRARLELNSNVALNLSAADLYYSGTQFISPVQVFGNQLQLPLTFTIPAAGTTPAQIVTTLVLVPRDLLVAGNGNLGLTTASNNAVNRDGRLASGFNLVDLLARLELKHSKQFPVTILLNLVTNTQTRDVVRAGPEGADLILPNHENQGFWGEIQVGSTRARGDMLFGYTFMRVEKDAVLTPFNYSDITQQSDMRVHRLAFAYAVDPRVTLSITGIVTQRANGLLGPFVPTPLGSLDRATTRLQFDTVIRF